MGLYLNSRKPHNNYQEIPKSDYFMDKTSLPEEMIPIVGAGGNTDSHSLATGQGNKYKK